MAKRNANNNISKLIVWGKYILLIGVLYAVYIFFVPNIRTKDGETNFLYLRSDDTFENTIRYIQHRTKGFNVLAFRQVATLLHYGSNIRPGRYALETGMSNFELVKILRSGQQTPVKLTFNNIRTKEQLAGRLAKQLMEDSLAFLKTFNDTAYLEQYNLTPTTAVTIFIPNTYEVFWNSATTKIFERMYKEYEKFWNQERKAKAEEIPLTPTEVSILASIVEEETNKISERRTIAGLYINRLKLSMPLQADPTVKFALGDFGIRRILYGHLRTHSPYNTYKNIGLPPGPIRISTSNSIDAVLNYHHHDYIFMCASELLNGSHNFSATWQDHKANAVRYQQSLNQRGIH